MMPALNSIPLSLAGRRWIFAFGLVTVMLILPSSCAIDPLLYSAKNASTTGYHQDLSATGDMSRDDAALVLQEWANSLDLTGSFVHDIKLRDFRSAERSLQQYNSSGKNLEHLVIHLDMTDTDVATFQHDNDSNILSLHDLLNQTRDFDELQDEEAAFSDQKNISGLKSVELRGDDLRTKVHANYEEYAGRYDLVVNISRNFGLDTSAFEQSITDFAAILAEIDGIQTARSTVISKMIQEYKGGSPIGFDILPDHGAYGETLSMAGTVDAPAGTKVRVFVDGLQAGGGIIETGGRFSIPFRIEQIEARTHTAYASVGSDISDVSTFTVEGDNTTISFAVRLDAENQDRIVVGTGSLVTEDGVPVRGARVSVNFDGRVSWDYGLTGDDGVYTLTTEHLSPGVHTLKTRFDPVGFPLNGSESTPVTVQGTSHVDWIASLVYFLAVGGAGVGGVLFLRGRHENAALPTAGTVVAAPVCLVEPRLMPTIEESRMMAEHATVTKEGRVDMSETVAQIYRLLVRELEVKNPDLRLRSRTPRNLAVLFADRPFGDQTGVFIGVHEKVRYAEHDPTEEDLHLVREAFIYIITGGSGH